MTEVPRIAVTADIAGEGAESTVYTLRRAYADAIIAAGGLPFILPCAADEALAALHLASVDGLVISGGAFDIPPELFGETGREGLGPLKPERTAYELALLNAAMARELPVLGICGGMQLINVAFGGTLYQDLPRELPAAAGHEQVQPKTLPQHEVALVTGTVLARWVGADSLRANSTHHQGIAKVGEGLTVSAKAADGLVEGIESLRGPIVGVQWHPELLRESAAANFGIYRGLVEAARLPR